MELAVNMPEQDPQVGQAERSIFRGLVIADARVGGHDHGVDEVDRAHDIALLDLAGFHGAAGNEDRGMFRRSEAISIPA